MDMVLLKTLKDKSGSKYLDFRQFCTDNHFYDYNDRSKDIKVMLEDLHSIYFIRFADGFNFADLGKQTDGNIITLDKFYEDKNQISVKITIKGIAFVADVQRSERMNKLTWVIAAATVITLIITMTPILKKLWVWIP